MTEPVIAFIGAGNMAEALLGGLLEAGWPAERLIASHPRADRRSDWESRYGIAMLTDNAQAARQADVVVVSVKPNKLAGVLPELAPGSAQRLTVSVAAGTPLRKLSSHLEPTARVIRTMPNQASRVGAGMTGLVAGQHATPEDVQLAERIFAAVGRVEILTDEAQIDALTGVAGSGPAFVYRVAEALAAAGVAEGLPDDLARRLAAQTIFGAGAILAHDDTDPTELVRRVASPGGTTQAGLEALESAGGLGGIEAAVRAATRRAAEIAGEEN